MRADDNVAERRGEIVLCTYRAAAKHYFRDSVDGINIVFVNLTPFVFIALFDGYIMPIILGGDVGLANPLVVFFLSLVSVIPLVYFVGLGVACVSAQSNLALGAVVNATFGSLVEIILYILALREKKGTKWKKGKGRRGKKGKCSLHCSLHVCICMSMCVSMCGYE